MKTNTSLSNEQLDIYKNQLKNMLKIKDYQINNLDFLPNSQKYIAVIEVKLNDKVYILDACRATLSGIADDLTDQYSGMVFCKNMGAFSRTIREHFV